MDNDFKEFEDYVHALSDGLKPPQLKKMSKAMAIALKQSNARRITANIEPDGGKMTPRTPKKYMQPENAATFLYPSSGSGKARLVHLTEWTMFGNFVVGYDEKKRARRRFNRSKIIRWLPPRAPASKIGENFSKSISKSKKLFPKAKDHLKSNIYDDGFKVGFYGNAAMILAIHQYSKTAPINEKSKRLIHYPKREVLGISRDDMNMLADKAGAILDVKI